jgi:UDP-N-acetylglucosamine--N-acetylmuramyl-(pentapeptide) pyrophosphoryl-undecaprenol N-acetylglucosamine transferase
MKYLMTGGGTGGHLYPALAVARELAKDPDNELLYVGIRGRAEEKILGGERKDPRIPLVYAMSEGFPGRSLRLLPGFLFKLGWGCLQAAGHLLRFRPDLVFATGGYASAPTVFAAWGLGKLGLLETRILVHEQNAQPGLMNQKAAKLADLVTLTYPTSSAHLPTHKIQLVGYPVRRDLTERPTRQDACRLFDLDPAKPVLLVFGGSQGARCINRTLYQILPELLEDGVQVIHGYGTATGKNYDAGKEHHDFLAVLEKNPEMKSRIHTLYRPFDFLHDIRQAYAAATLVVARAGAGAIFELISCGIPTILIPKMGLPGDHQVANARGVQEAGAVEVILERPLPVDGGFEEEVDRALLMTRIRALLADPDRRQELVSHSKKLARVGVLDRFVKLAAAMASGEKPEYETPAIPEPADELGQLEEKSDEQLIGVAARGSLAPEAVQYLEYRCGAALSSANWKRRNRGIKLAGDLRNRSLVPLLLHINNDPRPAPFLARLLGQKGTQNGFIRRNLATAFGQIGDTSPEVIQALVKNLDDGYWEVRVESVRALAKLDSRNHPQDLVDRLLGFLDSRNFEEVLAALFFWNLRGEYADCQQKIYPLLAHHNIRIRERAMSVLAEQVRARKIPAAPLKGELQNIMVTTTWFTPGFPLKNNLRDLGQAVEEVLRS